MSTTTEDRIPNAIALVRRIAEGWTAEQCKAAITDLSPNAAQRWGHVIEGAETAYHALGNKAMQEVAEQMWDYLDEIANGKSA